MRVISYDDIPEWHKDTKTVQHLSTLLGSAVNALSVVVKLKRDLTLSILTDGLKRTYSRDKKPGMEASEALVFEWKIETTKIPRIKIMADCQDTGEGRTPVTLILEKNYYAPNDTFALENQQQLRVVQMPEKLAANRWRYTCVLVSDDLSKGLNTMFTTRGRTTSFRSNYYPELSERGSTKYMFNAEKHRGYISRHRVQDSVSNDANVVYFAAGSKGKEKYFQMLRPEKNLLDLFLLVRENNMLFGRSNHDATGRCLDTDDQGRAIPMGDGVIAQIERYCDKFSYSVLTTDHFDQAIESVIDKTGEPIDNDIVVICNRTGYRHAMKALEDRLRQLSPEGAWFYTRDKQKVSVGANYQQYNYNHNRITFTIDSALSEEYRDFGYLVFLDVSISKDTGKPNLATFTLKGREMVECKLPGMGGLDGKTNGVISSPIDGVQYHILGYSGVAVFNPYAGFILQENVSF